MGTKKVQVMRAFYFGGKALKAGSIVDLPATFALEVIAANKAIEVKESNKTEVHTEKTLDAEKKPNANIEGGKKNAK